MSLFKSVYQKSVDAATSSQLVQQDWTMSLELCDLINNESDPKSPKTNQELLTPIRKRFNDKRNQVKFITLEVIDIVMKNCGKRAHEAIFEGDFVEEMLRSLTEVKDHNFRQKLLEMIHLWQVSFESIEFPTFYILATRMFNHVKNEGYALPEIDQAEVIVIPGKPVAKSASATSYNQSNQQPSGQYPSGQPNNNQQLSKQEDDELALALKLSMQEQENQPKQRTSTQVKLEDLPAAPVEQNAYPDLAFLDLNSDQPKNPSTHSSRPESVNFESRTDKFIESPGNFNPPGYNSIQETDNSEKLTSITLEPGSYEVDHPEIVKNVISGEFDSIQMLDPGNEFLTEEDEVFVRNYNKSLDILQLRINSCHQRGRLIQQDATAQQLFTTVTQQHEKLLTIMAIIDAQRQHFENFNDKLKDMKDVREAIVDTREQIRIQEETRRQEEEQQRKVAMQMKLEKLRQDKDMWMQQQRIHAMARMQGYNNPHIQQQQLGFMQNGYPQQLANGYQMNNQLDQTHLPETQQINQKQAPQKQVSQQQVPQQHMPHQQMLQPQEIAATQQQIPQQQTIPPPSSQNAQFNNNSYQQLPQFYQQQGPPPPQMENQPPTAPTPVPYAPMPTPPYNQQMYPPQPQQFMQFQDPGQQQPIQRQPVQQQPVEPQFVSETDDDALIKFD